MASKDLVRGLTQMVGSIVQGLSDRKDAADRKKREDLLNQLRLQSLQQRASPGTTLDKAYDTIGASPESRSIATDAWIKSGGDLDKAIADIDAQLKTIPEPSQDALSEGNEENDKRRKSVRAARSALMLFQQQGAYGPPVQGGFGQPPQGQAPGAQPPPTYGPQMGPGAQAPSGMQTTNMSMPAGPAQMPSVDKPYDSGRLDEVLKSLMGLQQAIQSGDPMQRKMAQQNIKNYVNTAGTHGPQ